MVLHRSEVMVSVSNASRIVVYPLVRSEHGHITLHNEVLDVTHVCLFVYSLSLDIELDQLRILELPRTAVARVR